MDENRILAELSDEEMITLLKVHEGERDWTVRELIEVERRGLGFLAHEPSLEVGIKAVLEEMQEKVKRLMSPAFESLNIQADYARNLSRQLQGIGQQWNLKIGHNALAALQTQSDAYRKIIDDSSLGINSQLAKKVTGISNLGGISQLAKSITQLTAPYEGLLAASKLAIGNDWAKRLIDNQSGANTEWIASRVQSSLQQQANAYKEFSENLRHTGVETQNKLDNEYLQETAEIVTLDLPISDPILPTSVAENMLRKMTTAAEVLAFIGVRRIETSSDDAGQPPNGQSELGSVGDAPKRKNYLSFLLVAALATESYFLFLRK